MYITNILDTRFNMVRDSFPHVSPLVQNPYWPARAAISAHSCNQFSHSKSRRRNANCTVCYLADLATRFIDMGNATENGRESL